MSMYLHTKIYAHGEKPYPCIRLGTHVLSPEEALLYTHIIGEAKPYMKKQNDPAHDIEHAKFVIKNALDIAEQEGGDRLVLIAAGGLHDIINYPKGHHKAKESAEDSAKLAGNILTHEKYNDMLTEEQIRIIQNAIRNHSIDIDTEDHIYLESKILQDADNLDKIGWRGILRTAAYGKHKDRKLHHFTDPLAESKRELDPSKYMLDYFIKLLRKLPGKLHTPTAQKIAPELMLPIYGLLNGVKQQTANSLLDQKVLLTEFSKN